MTSTPKHVVILGCGFGGASTASYLDKHPEDVTVTVVSPRENFLLHKFSALRAAVVDDGWTDRTMIPVDKLLKNGKIVQAKAERVDLANKSVTIKKADGEESDITFDYLVVATGSRNFSPAEPPVSASSQFQTRAYYTQMHAYLALTKNVVIVGGGSVGLELAGEIRHFGQPNAKITIITRGTNILDGGKIKSNLPEKGIRSVRTLLEKLNVEVRTKLTVHCHGGPAGEIISLPRDLSNEIPVVPTPNGIKLSNGDHVNCDLVVFAVGYELNTKFLPEEWLDPESKEVIVDPKTLQLVGQDPNVSKEEKKSVFCIGDVAKVNFTKLGYFATADADTVAQNIIQRTSQKEPTHHIFRMNMMAIVLGPTEGRVILPFTTLGSFLTRKLKGQELFTSRSWGIFNRSRNVPPLE